MELTKEQIENLYQFTRQHYVAHYDVQTELVDHLANDIEQIWIESPKLSFEEARDKSFKKFGIFGFMDVVQAKRKQLEKKYRKILWRYMKEWFSVPKIILTLSLFLLFYILMSLNIPRTYFSFLLLLLAVTDLILALMISRKAKQRFKEKKRTFLLEEMIFRAGSFSSILVFSNLFQLSSHLKGLASSYYNFFVALSITLAIIYSYIALMKIPQKADELLEETYPAYKML